MYPGYQRFFLACGNWVLTIKTWLNRTRHLKSLLHLGEGEWTWMQTFVCKKNTYMKRKQSCQSRLRLCRLLFQSANFCVFLKFNPLLPHIFQIMDKVNNVIQVHGMSSQPSWGVLLGILDRVVPPSSLNPDPISDHFFCLFLHPFSDQNSAKTIPFGAAWLI